jgi:hypothetical protein
MERTFKFKDRMANVCIIIEDGNVGKILLEVPTFEIRPEDTNVVKHMLIVADMTRLVYENEEKDFNFDECNLCEIPEICKSAVNRIINSVPGDEIYLKGNIEYTDDQIIAPLQIYLHNTVHITID